MPGENLLTCEDDSGYNLGEINPIRYRGYYYDTETGYYYCQSRYYNPEWCRWISADVFFDTQDGILSTNMYAYCHNNPMMLVDPSGTVSRKTTDLLVVDIFNEDWFSLVDELLKKVAKAPTRRGNLINISYDLSGLLKENNVKGGLLSFSDGTYWWEFEFVYGRAEDLKNYADDLMRIDREEPGFFEKAFKTGILVFKSGFSLIPIVGDAAGGLDSGIEAIKIWAPKNSTLGVLIDKTLVANGFRRMNDSNRNTLLFIPITKIKRGKKVK